MPYISSRFIPALGLAAWGGCVALIGEYDFMPYLMTTIIVAFITGLLYRKTTDAEAERAKSNNEVAKLT